MLDAIHPWGAPVRPYLSARIEARIPSEPWELEAYWALRQAVFVEEQRLFAGSDRDEHDAHATPIVALGEAAGMADDVVGAVRIYEVGDGVWLGGRLAVARGYRRLHVVGASLIHRAVSSAARWGCTRFLATVQEANVPYFERQHFHPLTPLEISGHPHRLMQADLPFFARGGVGGNAPQNEAPRATPQAAA